MVQRLMTKSCQVQAKRAMEKEAAEEPLQAAFGVMGRLAMQELLANPQVKSSFSGYVKYLDVDRLRSAFSSK
jgi:hypothetical protein